MITNYDSLSCDITRIAVDSHGTPGNDNDFFLSELNPMIHCVLIDIIMEDVKSERKDDEVTVMDHIPTVKKPLWPTSDDDAK